MSKVLKISDWVLEKQFILLDDNIHCQVAERIKDKKLFRSYGPGDFSKHNFIYPIDSIILIVENLKAKCTYEYGITEFDKDLKHVYFFFGARIVVEGEYECLNKQFFSRHVKIPINDIEATHNNIFEECWHWTYDNVDDINLIYQQMKLNCR